MKIHVKIVKAMMRGDEVAFAKAARTGTYHEGPWKTFEQVWFDMQQVEKESPQSPYPSGLNRAGWGGLL